MNKKQKGDKNITGTLFDRRGEGVSILLFFAACGIGIGLQFLSSYLKSNFLSGLSWQFLISVVPVICGLLEFRTYRISSDLKRQEDKLKSRVGSDSIFAQLGSIDSAERLHRVNRFLSISSDVLLLIVSAALSIHFFSVGNKLVGKGEAPGIVFCGFIAFAAYVGGKYLSALGEQSRWKPLKTSGKWFSCCGILAFFGVVAFGLARAGLPQVLIFFDRLVPFWFLLFAVDKILSILGWIYGLNEGWEEPCRSRLIEIAGEPAVAYRSIGDALGYNFGVKLTKESFGRFIVEIFCPFLLAAGSVFILLSCFAWIEPGHVGIVERFGRQTGEIQEAGLHLKLPWPVDSLVIENLYSTRIGRADSHNSDTGNAPAEDLHNMDISHKKEGEHEEPKVILWSEDHGDRYFFLTPSWGKGEKSVGLLAMAASVRFSVGDPSEYAYQAVNPEKTVKFFFKRALVQLAASSDPKGFFDGRRKELLGRLSTMLEKAVKKYGIRINDVALEHVHMPLKVAGAFEDAAVSMARKEASVLGAEAEEIKLKSIIRFEKSTLLLKSETQASQIVTRANGLSVSTEKLAPFWHDLGGVVRKRLVLESMRELGKNKRKVILPRNLDGTDVFEVNPGEGIFFSGMNGAGK